MNLQPVVLEPKKLISELGSRPFTSQASDKTAAPAKNLAATLRGPTQRTQLRHAYTPDSQR